MISKIMSSNTLRHISSGFSSISTGSSCPAQPARKATARRTPNEVIVNITKKGEYLVVGETLDEPTLAAFLRDLSLKNPGMQTIQIRADQDVSFKFPARVMGLCEDERISHYCSVLEEH